MWFILDSFKKFEIVNLEHLFISKVHIFHKYICILSNNVNFLLFNQDFTILLFKLSLYPYKNKTIKFLQNLTQDHKSNYSKLKHKSQLSVVWVIQFVPLLITTL